MKLIPTLFCLLELKSILKFQKYLRNDFLLKLLYYIYSPCLCLFCYLQTIHLIILLYNNFRLYQDRFSYGLHLWGQGALLILKEHSLFYYSKFLKVSQVLFNHFLEKKYWQELVIWMQLNQNAFCEGLALDQEIRCFKVFIPFLKIIY